MSNQRQVETIVSLRKNQTREMLYTLSHKSTQEANECKNWADASTQALKAYYQQLGAAQYNLNEALNALVTLTDRSQKTVHSEQQKKILELSNKLTLALYMGFPEQFVPSEIKNQQTATFSASPQGKEPIQAHPGGSNNIFSNKKSEETQSGLKGPLLQDGKPQ